MTEKSGDLKQFDEREWYCRMLGHALAFRYCRTMQEGLPCHRILDCWYEFLPIKEFVESNYTEEELVTIFQQPKSRIDIMLDTVKRLGQKGGKD